jgi:hypothetical protein
LGGRPIDGRWASHNDWYSSGRQRPQQVKIDFVRCQVAGENSARLARLVGRLIQGGVRNILPEQDIVAAHAAQMIPDSRTARNHTIGLGEQ